MTFNRFLEILKDVEATTGATASTVVLVKAVANELEAQKASPQGLSVGAFAETLKQGANLAAQAVAKNPLPVSPAAPPPTPALSGATAAEWLRISRSLAQDIQSIKAPASAPLPQK